MAEIHREPTCVETRAAQAALEDMPRPPRTEADRRRKERTKVGIVGGLGHCQLGAADDGIYDYRYLERTGEIDGWLDEHIRDAGGRPEAFARPVD